MNMRWDPEVVYNCDWFAEEYYKNYEDYSYNAINDFVMLLAVPEAIMSSSSYENVIELQKNFTKAIFDRVGEINRKKYMEKNNK